MLSDQDLSSNTEMEARWQRWLLAFLLMTAGFTFLLYAAVVAIDPYSTGRFALTQSIDLATKNMRFSKIAVARDPRFDAAILGPSTSLPLDPQAIGEPTGWRVAQLSITGSSPAEELAVARSFERYHQSVPIMEVFALDYRWCLPEPMVETENGAVALWLFQGSDVEYLSRILFPDAVKSALRRVGIWTGFARPAQRSDGLGLKDPAWKHLDLTAYKRPETVSEPDRGFPQMEGLVAHIARLRPEDAVVLLLSPFYLNTQPVPGSPADLRLKTCKAYVGKRLENERPNTVVVDLMTDNEITRNPDNFYDHLHYTPAAARLIEKELIDAILAKGLVHS